MWPDLVSPLWPALTPGQARQSHLMHEPACILFAWPLCVIPSLQNNRSFFSCSSMSTNKNLCIVMLCITSRQVWCRIWGQKRKSFFLQLISFFTFHANVLMLTSPSSLLLLTLLLRLMGMPVLSHAQSLLQCSVCYKHPRRDRSTAVFPVHQGVYILSPLCSIYEDLVFGRDIFPQIRFSLHDQEEICTI